MDTQLAWAISVIGLVVTTASFVFAVKTSREKRQLQKMMKETLAGILDNVAKIEANPGWADHHFGVIRDFALDADKTEQISRILWHSQEGSRDAAAAQRMLGILHRQVEAMLAGLFSREPEGVSRADKGSPNQSVEGTH